MVRAVKATRMQTAVQAEPGQRPQAAGSGRPLGHAAGPLQTLQEQGAEMIWAEGWLPWGQQLADKSTAVPVPRTDVKQRLQLRPPQPETACLD